MKPGGRLGLTLDETRARLDDFSRRYDGRFLDSDPLGIVRRFELPEDRELVGLLAAGLAYGRVEAIRSGLDRLLSVLGPRPSRFLEAFDPDADARRFDGFRHRFTRGRDVARLLGWIAEARRARGSLEALFVAHDRDPGSPDLGPAMTAFADALFSLEARPRAAPGGRDDAAGARWLLPRPADGSACKRHCLFLRWMVRPDDGIDCGIWTRVSRARLVVPLDIHVERVAKAIGWTRRRSASWAMAVEVTATLRRLDPADPTRYDFALSRLGILGLVRARGGRVAARDVAEALRAHGG
jgi:uncharacterized protein (TIGR02757 family)